MQMGLGFFFLLLPGNLRWHSIFSLLFVFKESFLHFSEKEMLPFFLRLLNNEGAYSQSVDTEKSKIFVRYIFSYFRTFEKVLF